MMLFKYITVAILVWMLGLCATFFSVLLIGLIKEELKDNE
jgi:hypothetical protein